MDDVAHEHAGLYYKKNRFGDILLLLEEIPQEDFLLKLYEFMKYMDGIKGTPCIIEVPHEKASVLSTIKEVGFELYHANNEKTEWIFKNGSSIPEPYTASIGTHVLVQKDDTVLVVEEKTRRGLLGFPGGTTDFQELMRDTAVRELKEEVNLSAFPSELKLFAIRNRVKANRFNANSIDHYFTIDATQVNGELKPDGEEVIRAFYAPLQDIIDQKNIQGLAGTPSFAALAEHLQNGRERSYSQNFPDFRQLSKPVECRDNSDIMTIEFFAQ